MKEDGNEDAPELAQLHQDNIHSAYMSNINNRRKVPKQEVKGGRRRGNVHSPRRMRREGEREELLYF